MASYEIIHVHLEQIPNSLALTRTFYNTAFHGHDQAKVKTGENNGKEIRK